MPMSGVRSQLLPLHGELSARSFAPAANTAGLLASIASAGSLEPLGRYGVAGLPTVTLLSADTALAGVGSDKAAVRDTNPTRMTVRLAMSFLLSWRPGPSIPMASDTHQRDRERAVDR